MTTVLAVVAVVLVVCAFSPPAKRFFRSVWRVGEAKLDAAGEAISNLSPLEQLKASVRNSAENGANARKIVQSASAQVEKLQRQIAADRMDLQALNAKLARAQSKGDPNGTMARNAAEVVRVERNLKANEDQLAEALKLYDENLKLIGKYEAEVVAARKDAEQLGFQLDQSQARKEITELASKAHDQLNLTQLQEARARVQRQIDENNGAARANRDLSAATGGADDADDELEVDASVAEVLARFQTPGAPVPAAKAE